MDLSTFLSGAVLFYLLNSCEGFPKPQAEEGGGAGGLGSALSGFQSGFSSVLNNSNMKEAKMVVGGFSFFIIPSPDMAQLSQMNPGQIPQMPSLPTGKK